MALSEVQLAKSAIGRHFDQLPQRVFKPSEIALILSQERPAWQLTRETSLPEFIKFLLQEGKLRRFHFPFPYRKEIRYAWGRIHLLQVLLTLKKDSYFTHFTSVRLHGLTEQIPKTIYVNHEQPSRAQSTELVQERVDAAFSRRARVSRNVITFGDTRICLVNGMNTGRLGVIEDQITYDSTEPIPVRFTNLERTLIDITVRPAYAGGVSEVLKAYRLARDRVSVNRLSAMLQKLRYLYPYHQAIGFYLERAGYKQTAVELLRRFPIELDFYLANQMGKTDYIEKWRLHVPRGF